MVLPTEPPADTFSTNTFSREIIRAKVPPAAFFLFNVTFISLGQSILLFLIATPTYVLLLASKLGAPFGGGDIAFARVLMGLILVEFFADQQQWSKVSKFSRITYCLNHH